MRRYIRWILIALVASIAILTVSFAVNAQNAPGDYSFRFDIEIHNNTNDTFSGLAPFIIDADTLTDSGFINSDASDVLFTNSNDTVVRGMVEDATSTNAYWWIETEVTPGQTKLDMVYTGGPAEEKYFPANAINLTRLEVNSTSTLEIDDNFAMQATVETDTCGTIIGKTNLRTEDNAAGYGMYYVGNEDFPVFNGSLQGLAQYIFYDITPLQDVWICGAGVGRVGDLSAINRIRIQNASTSDVVLDTVPVYTPNTRNTDPGSAVLFRDIALLEEGVTYHMFFDGDASTTFVRQAVFGGGFPELMVATGTVAIYEQPSASTSFDGNTYRAPGFQIDDSFSGTGIVGVFEPGILYMSPTTTIGRLESVINCNVIDLTWNGAKATFATLYTVSFGEMEIQANGLPFFFPFPSCQTFGNKSGGEDLTTLALSSYLNPGSERLGGTLFTAPLPGTLEAINAKIRWSRDGNSADSEMNSTLQAALYNASSTLIAQTSPISITLPSEGESHIENYSMSFASPPAISSSTDYYMMVWADNIEVGDDLEVSGFVGGNDGDPEDHDESTSIAQRIRFCDIRESSTISFSNELAFLNSIRFYMQSVTSGSAEITAAIYRDTGSDIYELLEVSSSVAATSNDYAEAFFSGTTLLDPDNETYKIAVFSNEGSSHTVKFAKKSWNRPAPSPITNGAFTSCRVYDPASPPGYPSFPSSVDLSDFVPGTNPDLTQDAGGNAMTMRFDLTLLRIVQQLEIHLTTRDETGIDVVYDSEAYDGSFPDPFATDDTTNDKVAVIWGDLIPSTTDSIATSTDTVIIGAGLTGKLDNVSISEVGPRMNLTMQGNEIFNTQIGNASNDWQWLGTVEDQSGIGNDATYYITSDISGVSIISLPLGASAVAVPVPERTFPNIYGTPDVVSPATPIPTIEAPLIEPVRKAIEGNDLQEETAYIFIATFVLALISSVIMKPLPFDFIPWIIGILGYAILSQVAGPFFLVMWVILYGLWATGLWLVMHFARR